jgi:hypothetical protein
MQSFVIMATENKPTCKFCGKSFAKETTLISHMCEQKRRHQQKDDAGVRIGYNTYLIFYKATQGNKVKTYEDFAKSPYYSAFVKFGNYCIDIKAVKPEKFAEYVIKTNKKLDYWCSDSIYTEYLSQQMQTENTLDALRRAIETSIKWAEQNNANPQDILRYGNANKACQLIAAGRISPWVLYNCESGQELLGNLTEDQVKVIWDYIDPEIWNKKIKDYPDEVATLKEILKEAGW